MACLDAGKSNNTAEASNNHWYGSALSEWLNADTGTRIGKPEQKNCAGEPLPTLELGHELKAGTTTDLTMKVDGKDRHFRVHVPPDYDGTKPMPLMIVFNGLGYGYNGLPGGGPGMEAFTGLSAKADAAHFIVAYPDGEGPAHGYNNGQYVGAHADDVKFTRQMIDSLEAKLKVDQDKVYLLGFSEGGSFVHKAAGELSDKLAGVADIPGFMTGHERKPRHHLSVFSMHSVDDGTIPYDGSDAYNHKHPLKGKIMDLLGLHGKSANYTQSTYRADDGITATPLLTETKAPDGTRVHIADSANPKDGSEVMQVTVEKRDHGWFGSSDSPQALSATDTAVDFLLRHKRIAESSQ